MIDRRIGEHHPRDSPSPSKYTPPASKPPPSTPRSLEKGKGYEKGKFEKREGSSPRSPREGGRPLGTFLADLLESRESEEKGSDGQSDITLSNHGCFNAGLLEDSKESKPKGDTIPALMGHDMITQSKGVTKKTSPKKVEKPKEPKKAPKS